MVPLRYIDRRTGELQEETIAGLKYLKWLYTTQTGRFVLATLVRRKLFSAFYGKLQDTEFSRRKIPKFITELQIDLSEAKIEDPSGYRTFNDFFSRQLKPEARPIAAAPNLLISPADGRVLAWDNIDKDRLIQVKGMSYTLADLLQDPQRAIEYHQGTCLVIRLSPADYHRFHFPDSGVPEKSQLIKGCYYSVNPLALAQIPRLYCANKRELTLFHSDNFGEMLLIEVGATCVGSIVQTYTPSQLVAKGSEKGYFKFGGSTVIMLLKKGIVRIDPDLLANTAKGLETRVLMGERIGVLRS